tara:strand:- start:245 stop:565 length:321 start_codon:yes stop_codon:yes gene_type:complete
MIDQIKNKISSSDLNSSNSSLKTADGKTNAVKVQQIDHSKKARVDTDNGKVSKFISKERIKDMAKEPPIDKVSTSRIKAAIANGSYPIDLNKIADALFDAYKEMKD